MWNIQFCVCRIREEIITITLVVVEIALPLLATSNGPVEEEKRATTQESTDVFFRKSCLSCFLLLLCMLFDIERVCLLSTVTTRLFDHLI